MKSTKSISSQVLYIYTTDGVLKSKTTIEKYASVKKVIIQKVKSAASSFKGYGYVDGDFVSFRPLERLLTIKEVTKMFDTWLKDNLNRVKKMYVNMSKKPLDEDCLQDSIMYILNAINSPRSINDFGEALTFKYKTLTINSKVKAETHKSKGFSEDLCYYDKDGNEHSYIQSVAEESFFDTKPNYDCVDDYNDIKRLDVIGYILKETYHAEEVDFFIDILQSDIGFTNLNSIPNFKYHSMIIKNKTTINSIKRKVLGTSHKTITDKRYMVSIIEKCWEQLVKSKSRIISESELHTFRTIDNYTLAEIIE